MFSREFNKFRIDDKRSGQHFHHRSTLFSQKLGGRCETLNNEWFSDEIEFATKPDIALEQIYP